MDKKAARIDIDAPLWDQSTFIGRFKHFAFMTDPRTVLATENELNSAKAIVEQYRLGKEPSHLTQEEIIYAKKLYSSAFHPDTGELQNVIGRMSFQVPGGMIVTGGMLQFYRTIPAVVFWQFANQSYNAVVNYTNRNANSPVSVTQLGVSYVSATTSALIAAISCKNYWQKRAGLLMQRFVPLAAVIAANCVNIPMMRQTELTKGIDVVDENNNQVGKSRIAAVKGISQVVFSRIVMTVPGMVVLPLLMQKMESTKWFMKMKNLHAPFQVLIVGGFLVGMVPSACAIFPQRCSLNMSTIQRFEKEFYDEMKEKYGDKLPDKVGQKATEDVLSFFVRNSTVLDYSDCFEELMSK